MFFTNLRKIHKKAVTCCPKNPQSMKNLLLCLLILPLVIPPYTKYWSTTELNTISRNCDTLHVFKVNKKKELKVLRMPCNELSNEMIESPEFNVLVAKMIATVQAPQNDGVGLAGPQVGICRRIVAVMRYDKEGMPFEVYPNICIERYFGHTVVGAEGCLSVPGKKGEVPRFKEIEISYTDPCTLEKTVERVSGFTAVIFQHECDHLDGILYTDKARNLSDKCEK